MKYPKGYVSENVEDRRFENSSNETNISHQWFGVGEKAGGTAFFIGVEDLEGLAFNLQNPSSRFAFGATNMRLGIGLGASAGLCALMVFDCPNPNSISGKDLSDWGVNLAVGGQWSKVAKVLGNTKFYALIGKLGTALRLTDRDVAKIRDIFHQIYNCFDTATMNRGVPKVLVIDLPAGIGIEVSAFYSFGKLRVY